ncbi:ROK family protein [Stigmatella sp. ncwal1]|uniref:ROK family protein n=1 Tax=Stigmatella ashevillensis TaxID=2995309 RepID=A0ABT5DHP9_9BACT|nr:ROK family protein [Stigmatella ashevillena]MDC0713189.1 ROK family protein [Stigmatella ashevillena]
MARYVVIDIGGTNLRSAVFDSTNQELLDVGRGPVENFLNNPGVPPEQLFDKLIQQVLGHIRAHAGRHPIAGVGISFPGPVNERGEVHSAPTLWGTTLRSVPLGERLQREFDIPVAVMNDISAAVFRYQPWFNEDFGVITISSGIGNKVFAGGRMLLNKQGLGGELGHHQVVEGDNALPCDCGGHGHLGAIASGRGTERLARLWARREPTRFRDSALWRLTNGEPERIDTHAVVSSILEGDALAGDVLAFGQAHLASCLAMLYNAIGVKRFVLIGGFCMALGERYLEGMHAQLARCDLFCLSETERQAMVCLGQNDDDHSLYGLGYYFLQSSQAGSRAA